MAWYDLPRGWFGPFGDNETELVSTNDDPAKHRLGKRVGTTGLNLGAISFNEIRNDGKHEEWALIRGRKAPNQSDGAIEAVVKAGNDEHSLYYMDRNAAYFGVPVFAPNLSGGGTQAVLQSPNGRVQLNAQDDGNLVLYVDGQAVRALFGLPPDQIW